MAGRSGEHRRVGACQHRQAETAGDDRRVRARAAADRDRPGQASVVGEPDQVRRVHLAADQDERAVRGGRHRAGEPYDDRLRDLPHVARALRQVRVGKGLEDRGLCFRGVAHGDLGGGARQHRGRRGGGQRRIGRDQRADLHDACLAVSPGCAELRGEPGAFRGHGGEGGGHVIGPRAAALQARASAWTRRAGPRGVGQVQLARRHPVGDRRTAEYRHRPASPALASPAPAAASRRAARISAVDAAPGSSCPTLRGPR